MRRLLIGFVSAISMLMMVVGSGSASPGRTQVADALVSVGSPEGLHPQNASNEPALAVDPTRPNVLAAGANDLVDMQACSQEASTTAGACSLPLGTFNLGVGLTGVYFSFDSGHSWIQPTYQGLTAADCDPTVEPCTPHLGPIHTVPNYHENGLRSRSDPGVAFGPAPDGNGTFSWDNGSRLYFATLATNLDDTIIKHGGINSTFAITVSHIDDVTEGRIADQSNWSKPYFVPAHISASAGLDKEQIWADNAASSSHFGNVYVCYSDFHSFGGGNFPLFPMVAVSADGGRTWKAHQVAPPHTNRNHGAYDGCTVRTDSQGVVYAWFTHFGGTSLEGSSTLIRSFNGGHNWRKPQDVIAITDPCFRNDPITGRCVMDGVAGHRIDLAAMPSVDIANGAPTGGDATDEIFVAWSDGSLGEGNEVSMVSWSTDRGDTFSTPEAVSEPGDRSEYAAPAVSPDGSTLYVVYQAILDPYQETTANPRPLHGVLRTATVGPDGVPTGWTTVYNGPTGDSRGSSQGRILYNEFMGDYVYAIATRTYGAGVWTDARRTADCPAMDDWRQASVDAGTLVFPAPWPIGDCSETFGNNDIWSATTG
jgi:hypothetical protein